MNWLRKLLGCPNPVLPTYKLHLHLLRQYDGVPVFEAHMNNKLLAKEIWPHEIDRLVDRLQNRINVEVIYA